MRNFCSLFGLISVGLVALSTTGCSRKETPAPVLSKDKPVPSPVVTKSEPPRVAEESGTVKFEIAFQDPKAVVLIE